MDLKPIRILVTGASGFIGQYFLTAIKNHFKIFALSRRLPHNPQLTEHPNITWIQADVSSEEAMRLAKETIVANGGVDFVLHLAGYYDFNYDQNPEYFRTNVIGTENVLEMSKSLEIKRFIFASSVAACNFPAEGEIIDEKTPPDADFEYARTKKKGEELTKEYSKHFNTSVVRFAAVFSDWCEYGPLFIFLKTWLSKSWKSRILGGKGEAAITYIHVNCLIDLILKIIKKNRKLKSFDIFNVSHETPVSHNEFFATATRYFYGKSKRVFHMPKAISYFGVVTMNIIGKIIHKPPFEKPWMMQYIDKKLFVNTKYTRETLDWRPTDRYKIQRRLLYMIEHMKSYPYEWQKRNLRAFKAIPMNPNFKIYQALEEYRDKIIDKILDKLLSDSLINEFKSYHNLDRMSLKKDVITVYQFIMVAVRSKDRVSALTYARQLASFRFDNGFQLSEILYALEIESDIIYNILSKHPALKGMERAIYDEISLTFQLMIDEIAGTYEQKKRENTPLHLNNEL